MDDKLNARCQLLADNYRVVAKSAKADINQMACLGALLYTNQEQCADEAEIRANRALLKSKVSIFGNLRGNGSLSLLSKMSLADNAEEYLDRVLDAYAAITEGKHFHSEFLVNAAVAMADFVDPADYAATVEAARAVFAKMRSAHPLLTGQEDMTLAILIALACPDTDAALAEADRCYELLKKEGFKLNKEALQSVSFILSLSDRPAEEKCARYRELRESLKEAGSKITLEALPIIAAFADLDLPADQIAREVNEVDEFLKHEKGFGGITGCGRQMRRLFACALVLQMHNAEATENNVGNTAETISGAIVEQIIVEIIEVIVIISIQMAIASSQAAH